MTIFQVRIKKQHDTKLITWENRYYVDASSISVASNTCLDLLVVAEQNIHNAGITIIEQVTSDLPLGGSFIAVPLSAACVNGVSGDELPGILTLNCQFLNTAHGRPDRKYYHVFWGETGQAGGVWGSTERTAVVSILDGLIADMDAAGCPLTDVDGNHWVIATADAQVGHHKFSKRSKRAVAGP